MYKGRGDGQRPLSISVVIIPGNKVPWPSIFPFNDSEVVTVKKFPDYSSCPRPGYVARGLICLASLLIGCSPSSQSSGPSALFVPSNNSHMRLEESTEEQAKREVLSSPTHFVVALEDDKEAWERATFFLENYVQPAGAKEGSAPAGAGHITSVVGTRWTLANPAGRGSYNYQISKQATPNKGYRYAVVCQPMVGGNKYQASLNAANVARFIKDGKLEVSLLSSGGEAKPR